MRVLHFCFTTENNCRKKENSSDKYFMLDILLKERHCLYNINNILYASVTEYNFEYLGLIFSSNIIISNVTYAKNLIKRYTHKSVMFVKKSIKI